MTKNKVRENILFFVVSTPVMFRQPTLHKTDVGMRNKGLVEIFSVRCLEPVNYDVSKLIYELCTGPHRHDSHILNNSTIYIVSANSVLTLKITVSFVQRQGCELQYLSLVPSGGMMGFFSPHHSAQNGSGSHQASYPMGTGGKAAGV
jgi:hypothetical protein